MSYCKIKNKEFDSFIYLNGGWIYYEKCPVCSMRIHSDGSNHREFWDNHVEGYELWYNEEKLRVLLQKRNVKGCLLQEKSQEKEGEIN